MQRTLAIDPGANMGWAYRLTPKKVIFGTQDFSIYAGVDGRAHAEFYKWFESFLYTAKPEIVVSEAPIFRGKYSEYLYGFSVIITMLCHAHKIPMERVHLMTIKKTITGHGGADKNKMIASVRELGFAAETEHEADALAILTFKEKHSGEQKEFTGKVVSLKASALNRIRRKKRGLV